MLKYTHFISNAFIHITIGFFLILLLMKAIMNFAYYELKSLFYFNIVKNI